MFLTAEGNPHPTYYWYHMADGDHEFKPLPALNGEDSLHIDEFTPEDCGIYKCGVRKHIPCT